MFLIVHVIVVALLLYLWGSISGLPCLQIFVVSCISDTKWCHCLQPLDYIQTLPINYLYGYHGYFSRVLHKAFLNKTMETYDGNKIVETLFWLNPRSIFLLALPYLIDVDEWYIKTYI